MRFGILGGTGPIATNRLLTAINTTMAQDYNAYQDSDYPEIVLTQLPIPYGDVTAHFKDVTVIQESLDILNHANCDLILVNCNSIHDLLPNLHSETPIMDNISTIENLYPEATVFCSQYAHDKNLWNNASPDYLQDSINQLIASSMKNSPPIYEEPLTQYLNHQTASQTLILGCTELNLYALDLQSQTSAHIIDTVDILTQIIIQLSLGKEPYYEIFA